MSEIISFVDESINCKQYLRTECHGSVLNWGVTDPVAWVVVRSSMQLSYLPGGPPDGTGCSCGITNSCENSAKKCNCDANILKWLLDDGYIVDKAALPITRLAYGDTEHNKEELYHTLGEVECTVKGKGSIFISKKT